MTTTKGKAKPKTHAEDPILTYGEVAEMVGKHKNTVSRWANDGLFGSLGRHPKNPKIVGIRKSQVDKFLGIFESAE